MGNSELISAILQAADGEIVGKIRLQKIVYLLEQAGLQSGFAFSYHHYGPYSEDVSTALTFAEIVDGAVVEGSRTTQRGFTFAAYSLAEGFSVERATVGQLGFDSARALIAKMKAETSIVIELAATIHWLKYKERVAEWRTELVRRKTTKATNEFIERALALLTDLQLA